MEKTIEMEMKLKIARRDLKKLLALDFVKKAIVADSCATKNLINTYYDTSSSVLTKNGIAYRIRECDGKFEATIKTEKIVIAGNIITSRGPATAADFSFKLLELLKDADTAKQIASGMLFI